MCDHLYVHVPFCRHICAYCDFCRFIYSSKQAELWLGELEKELRGLKKTAFQTVYLGGGTPSALSYAELERLLKLLKPYTQEVKEYTIEVNPETIDAAKVRLLRTYKLNRVSLGMQSALDSELKLMNRHHDYNDVKRAVELFKAAGIDNISLDLLYSLPNQDLAKLEYSLNQAIALDVKHLSLYSLQLEPHTLFYKQGYQPLDEETEADMYEFIESFLTSRGYNHYEVSNYALPGYESLHNLGYWRYDDFVGVSLGASGKEGLRRYDNTKNFAAYLNHEYRQKVIDLNLADAMFEQIMMSFRIKEGLDLKLFKERYGVSFFDHFKDAYAKHRHDFILCGDHLAVKNLALLNSLLVDFL